MTDLSEPTVDPKCPADEHGFKIEECICLASWLRARADAVDEQWAIDYGDPWD